MNEPCEYSLQCLGEKAEYACVAPENHQDCAEYRNFVTKAKQRDIHRRLNAVGSDKCQANVEEMVLRYNSAAMDFVMKKLGV
jgi:hypothetical protein